MNGTCFKTACAWAAVIFFLRSLGHREVEGHCDGRLGLKLTRVTSTVAFQSISLRGLSEGLSPQISVFAPPSAHKTADIHRFVRGLITSLREACQETGSEARRDRRAFSPVWVYGSGFKNRNSDVSGTGSGGASRTQDRICCHSLRERIIEHKTPRDNQDLDTA